MDSRHIHTPDDGRGVRIVRVNGRVIDNVYFADTQRGIVRRYPPPIKLHKHGKRLIAETLRGDVTVELVCGP